ncbi:MAG TPA: hypothetical protein VGL19_10580 [Polyangiaceae bacterium]
MAPRTLRYLLAALTLGGLCVALATQADARSPFWRPRPAPPPYSFSVEDEDGTALPTFAKDGRTFVLGEPGVRYNIRVRNEAAQRVEAVVSVDGRDAVSGEPGDYVNERGYVIAPYGSVLVEGFRRSLEEVAAFRFTSPGDSYSSRMGTPQNVGVIGVAFFPERARPKAPVIRRPLPRPAPLPYDYYGYNRGGQGASAAPGEPGKSASASPAAPSAAPREGGDSERRRDAAKGSSDDFDSSSVNNLGTEYGEIHESVVSSVPFERASATHPAWLGTLRYDDADGLTARGIDLSPYLYGRQQYDEPQAFPVTRFSRPPPR